MPEFRAFPAKMLLNQSGMNYFSFIIQGKIALYAKTETSVENFGSKSSSIQPRVKQLEINNKIGNKILVKMCSTQSPFIFGDEPFLLGMRSPF